MSTPDTELLEAEICRLWQALTDIADRECRRSHWQREDNESQYCAYRDVAIARKVLQELHMGMIRCGISYDEWYPIPVLWAHRGNVEYEGEGIMLPANLVRKYVEAVDAFLGVCEEIASEDPTSLGAPLGKRQRAALRGRAEK